MHGGKGKRRGKEFRGDGKKEERNIVSGMAYKATRPDTRHKMRLVSVLFTFKNNTGPNYGPTDLRTDGHDLL